MVLWYKVNSIFELFFACIYNKLKSVKDDKMIYKKLLNVIKIVWFKKMLFNQLMLIVMLPELFAALIIIVLFLCFFVFSWFDLLALLNCLLQCEQVKISLRYSLIWSLLISWYN